jgi:DNA replication protein DnaC
MRDIIPDLKALRLHGMSQAWADLIAQGTLASVESSAWLIEHLLEAERTDRGLRSVRYQMSAAKFPLHRDLAGFDFVAANVDRALISTLASMDFTAATHNVVFVGGPGTGKTHLATALGIAGIAKHGKRVRFYSTVDLVNALEREKAEGKAGRIALALTQMDAVILDELGYLPFSQAGGALLFHLLSKLYERTSVVITTNLLCGAPHNKFNAEHIVMQSPLFRSPESSYFADDLLRIKLPALSEAINSSVALKRPERSFGAMTDSSASSFTEGSARVYISVVCILACPSQRETFRRSLVACRIVSAQVCLNTCGLTRFVVNDGHCADAASACL